MEIIIHISLVIWGMVYILFKPHIIYVIIP